MANDFQWLLAMHETASRFGNGLKPELEALLRSDMSQFGPDVSSLPTRQLSSGPAHQIATKAQLEEGAIPSIAPGTPLREGWVNAREGGDRSTAEATAAKGVPRKN